MFFNKKYKSIVELVDISSGSNVSKIKGSVMSIVCVENFDYFDTYYNDGLKTMLSTELQRERIEKNRLRALEIQIEIQKRKCKELSVISPPKIESILSPLNETVEARRERIEKNRLKALEIRNTKHQNVSIVSPANVDPFLFSVTETVEVGTERIENNCIKALETQNRVLATNVIDLTSAEIANDAPFQSLTSNSTGFNQPLLKCVSRSLEQSQTSSSFLLDIANETR